ncbi:MAG: carboxypeptidase-like regulatory domain-containing protein [Bacteroidota bacterium]
MILLPVCSLKGQQSGFKLSGKVMDESNLEPMSGVAVWEPVSAKGTTTNANGDFSFEFKNFPVRFIFKSLGYFDDTLKILNPEQFRKHYQDTRVQITLRQNPFLIDEVVVSGKGSAIRMFKEEPYAIMDYVIQGNRFYALGYRNYNPLKPEIFIGNTSGRLLYASSLPSAQEICQDCQGTIYAVTNDNAYQLDNRHDTLAYGVKCDAGFFKTKVKPIVALAGPNYIYFESSEKGQYHDYYLGNYETGQHEIFYRVGNDKNEQEVVDINDQLRQEFISEINRSFIGSGELRLMHARQAVLRNKINTDFRPVQSALLQLSDSALLFDFDLQKIYCLTISGKPLWTSTIQADLSKDFTGRIHHDKITNRFFLEFLNIQSSYLIEINPETGEALTNIPIRQYRHIDHISVNNNRVYFLFQPDFGDKGKKLFNINL